MTQDHGLPPELERRAREALATLLLDRIVAEAVAELDLPHVVIHTEVRGGATSCRGPYPDALAAATAAERQRASLRRLGDEAQWRLGVAPLHLAGLDRRLEHDDA